MSVKLLTEHHFEFLSLKGGCTGSSEPIRMIMPHCWKSHVAAHFCLSMTALTLSLKPTLGLRKYENYSDNCLLASDIFCKQLGARPGPI